MGTKRDPGAFDCYDAAEPDEPMFILLGRDRHAPDLVRAWADTRERDGEDQAKVAEARECAEAMEAWRRARTERAVAPSSVGDFLMREAMRGRLMGLVAWDDVDAVVDDLAAIIVEHTTNQGEPQ